MRILVHDFAGHPFQVQLSRQLAYRGHEVTHVYPIGLAGPKGRLNVEKSDSARFSIRGIKLAGQFKKYSPCRRLLSHRKYANDLRKLIREIRPNVVLSGNTPIDVQAELLLHCRANHVAFVHWVQDVYCEALRFFLDRRFPWSASSIAKIFQLVEKAVSLYSDHTVVIAADFQEILCKWSVPKSKITVIENWAAIEEMPQMSNHNEWRNSQKLGTLPIVLYSGTLGMKHRPDLLYYLAKELQRQCTIVAVTEGIGRDYLDRMPRLENLRTLPFQPYEKMPQVLASADVLLATLEADAGRFAVPSKILTYLCAGRPILLAGPKENLSASIIERSKAGLVVDPNDRSACIHAVRTLIFDAELRCQLGRNGRSYAEQTFNGERMAKAFENIMLAANIQTHSSAVAAVTA